MSAKKIRAIQLLIKKSNVRLMLDLFGLVPKIGISFVGSTLGIRRCDVGHVRTSSLRLASGQPPLSPLAQFAFVLPS